MASAHRGLLGCAGTQRGLVGRPSSGWARAQGLWGVARARGLGEVAKGAGGAGSTRTWCWCGVSRAHRGIVRLAARTRWGSSARGYCVTNLLKSFPAHLGLSKHASAHAGGPVDTGRARMGGMMRLGARARGAGGRERARNGASWGWARAHGGCEA